MPPRTASPHRDRAASSGALKQPRTTPRLPGASVPAGSAPRPVAREVRSHSMAARGRSCWRVGALWNPRPSFSGVAAAVLPASLSLSGRTKTAMASGTAGLWGSRARASRAGGATEPGRGRTELPPWSWGLGTGTGWAGRSGAAPSGTSTWVRRVAHRGRAWGISGDRRGLGRGAGRPPARSYRRSGWAGSNSRKLVSPSQELGLRWCLKKCLLIYGGLLRHRSSNLIFPWRRVLI